MVALSAFLDWLRKSFVMRLPFYEHYNDRTRKELVTRRAQLIFGSFMFLSGLGFLLYNAISECMVYEFYLFYIGGPLLVGFDILETLTRWSELRVELLAHHAGAFALGMCLLEWGFVDTKEQVRAPIIIFLTLIALMWCVDYFHVFYRTCTSLARLQIARKVYLVLGIVRITNFCILAYLSVKGFVQRSYGISSASLLMTLGYGYNTYKALTFVFHFDCAKYYEGHQKLWLVDVRKSSSIAGGDDDGRVERRNIDATCEDDSIVLSIQPDESAGKESEGMVSCERDFSV